jgi:ADP-heptose:LPS heptosyltransferase
MSRNDRHVSIDPAGRALLALARRSQIPGAVRVMATLSALGQPESIVVFRALQLGDMLCAVPALRALRNAYPRARIALVGLPWCATFTTRFASYIDEFIEFPGYPGLPEIPPRIEAIPDFLAAMQRRRFDAAIQLHGSGSYVNSIVMLFNAKTTAGFFVPGEYCPDAERFIAWPEHEPEIMRYLKLLEHLGIAPADNALEFPLTPRDHDEYTQLGLAPRLKGKPYVIIHPGAQLRSRRWPPERFAEVASGLPDDHAVIITGSAAESPIAEVVEAAIKRDVINLAGKTTLAHWPYYCSMRACWSATIPGSRTWQPRCACPASSSVRHPIRSAGRRSIPICIP